MSIISMDDSKSLTKQSIDRTANVKKIIKKNRIREKIPDIVSQQVVEQILSTVGDADWNDPMQVSATLAKIMSIDTTQDIEKWSEQIPYAFDVDRTILVPARDRKKNKNGTIPYWIFQSVIRVDEFKNNRYVEHNGSKYNRIDIIFGNKYFKKRMDQVAKSAGCTWNARWGNARREQNRLYQKTRPGEESWLDKCVKNLLEEGEEGGINIKDLVMIEFKRKL